MSGVRDLSAQVAARAAAAHVIGEHEVGWTPSGSDGIHCACGVVTEDWPRHVAHELEDAELLAE